MVYEGHALLALRLLVVAAPLLAMAGVLRWRQLRRAGRMNPAALAGLEVGLVAGAIAVYAVTAPVVSSPDRYFDANPFAGVRSSGFPRLFLINFLLLPALVACFAGARFPILRRPVVALLSAGLFFSVIEVNQYLRGGDRVASSQDVVLAAVGSALIGALAGALVEGWWPTLSARHGMSETGHRRPRRKRLVVLATAIVVPLGAVHFIPAASGNSPAPLPGAASQCGLPEGSWSIPDEGPPVQWARSGGLLRPSAPGSLGPGEVGSGVANCFARNPSGALLAAAWAVPAASGEIAGFTIPSATPDEVSVGVVTTLRGSAWQSSGIAEWVEGDWRVILTKPQPLAKQSAFTEWRAG